MVIAISEGLNKAYIVLNSKDRRFRQKYDVDYKVDALSVYKELASIASWVNNDLNEECLFEMD